MARGSVNVSTGGAKIVSGTFYPDTAVTLGFEPDYVSVTDSYEYNDRLYSYESVTFKDYGNDIGGRQNSPVGGGVISSSWGQSYITITSTGFIVSSSVGADSENYQGTYYAGKF